MGVVARTIRRHEGPRVPPPPYRGRGGSRHLGFHPSRHPSCPRGPPCPCTPSLWVHPCQRCPCGSPRCPPCCPSCPPRCAPCRPRGPPRCPPCCCSPRCCARPCPPRLPCPQAQLQCCRCC